MTYEDLEVTTTQLCPGASLCEGESCVGMAREQSTSFGKVASVVKSAEMMADDMGENCTADSLIDGGASCRIFPTERYDCARGYFGVTDNCCNAPSTAGLGEYLRMLSAGRTLDTALINLASPTHSVSFASGYANLRNGAVEAVKSVTTPMVNSVTNTGATTAVKEVWSNVTTVTDQLKTQAAEAFNNIYYEVTGKTFFQEATTQGAANALVMPAWASTVMTVYSAYVLAETILSVLNQCDDEEFELATKKELKSCIYLETYCKKKNFFGCYQRGERWQCFNSPLARIVTQAVNAQAGSLGLSGSELPNDDGIPIGTLSKIDWDLVDLGE